MHLWPFSFLFILWFLVFVAVGLYDRHVALFENQLSATITEAQIVNLALAAIFFFVAPVGIQPKTVLALYFIISTLLIVVWRLGVFRFRVHQRSCEPALIVGTGPDMQELLEEIKKNPRSQLECAEFVDSAGMSPEALRAHVAGLLQTHHLTTLVADPRVVADLAQICEDPQYDVIDALQVYEALFDRSPLTLLHADSFFMARTGIDMVYDIVKRVLDIVLSFFLSIILVVLMPFVFIAIRIEGPGPLFITQERIGKNWKKITVNKFRSMRINKSASSEWTVEEKKDNPVTKVGALLRRTSIDELPQVFSVLKGDLSLIGPRSDIMGLGERLAEELPFYRMRYTATPGISGWAQVNQRYAPGNFSPQSIDESRVRLQYDLYYVKHRSLILDLSITLKTLKTLLKRIIP